MDKKILLIAYQFCPKGQIGTRRWSKFAKYLTRRGYEIHVLCAHYPYKDEINWCHDVEGNPRIKIHRIAARYPNYLLRPIRNFWIKLFDRIASNTLYYFDKSQLWGSVMVPTAVRLILQEEIRAVVVTGPPFSSAFQAIKIKKKLSGIKLLIDFRDPWTPWISKQSFLDKLRRRVGSRWESMSLETADLIMFTTQSLKKKYQELYPSFQDKFHVLFNGFDLDDFKGLSKPEEILPFHCIYTGSITKERALGLEKIVRAVAELGDDFIIKNFRIHIYGYSYNPPVFNDKELQLLCDKLITYCGVVTQSKVFSLIHKYEYCLSIDSPQYDTLIIPAKTLDYLGLNRKVFLISLPGELSNVLSQSGHYVSTYEINSIQDTLLRMKKDHLDGITDMNIDNSFFSKFEYSALTSQLEGYLKI